MLVRVGACVCVVQGRLVGGSFERWRCLALVLVFAVSRVCASRLLASLCVCVSCWPGVLCAGVAACACAACRACGVAACGRFHPSSAIGCDWLLDIPV